MDYQRKKIGNAGNISIGLVVKRKQAEKNDKIIKNYKMITLKSFAQGGWLDTDVLEEFQSMEVLDDKYITKTGDVLIRLSEPHTAIVIDQENGGLVIPSLFSVIRLFDDTILPEYLAIYLNSDRMKRLYSKQAIGSTIQIIKTSSIKDIEIKFPSIEEQKKVIEINSLILKEKELLLKLIEEKNLYYKSIINKVI